MGNDVRWADQVHVAFPPLNQWNNAACQAKKSGPPQSLYEPYPAQFGTYLKMHSPGIKLTTNRTEKSLPKTKPWHGLATSKMFVTILYSTIFSFTVHPFIWRPFSVQVICTDPYRLNLEIILPTVVLTNTKTPAWIRTVKSCMSQVFPALFIPLLTYLPVFPTPASLFFAWFPVENQFFMIGLSYLSSNSALWFQRCMIHVWGNPFNFYGLITQILNRVLSFLVMIPISAYRSCGLLTLSVFPVEPTFVNFTVVAACNLRAVY